jgi:aspartyl-tRNA synthetase
LVVADILTRTGKLSIPNDQWNFLWVIDFPLLEYRPEEGKYYARQHPFTAALPEDEHLLDSDPLKVRGSQYDLVLNGQELAGGSIRIHRPDAQRKMFEKVLQIPPEVARARFGYMLEAFRYGAPPHGGIAFGFDRLVATLCGTNNIRDVIAFPKTAKAFDLMTDSPSEVEPKQLRDLHIQLNLEP